MNQMDRLTEAVVRLQNPTVMGLDTRFEYLPEGFASLGENWLEDGAEAIFQYNKALIDGLSDIVPAVKVQVAFYEMYGLAGMACFKRTMDYASEKGMVVIADVKRGDIGSTAEAYAAAYIGSAAIGAHETQGFPTDIITVNPYLGTDGIKPFADACEKNGKGIFVLVKTSNPSSGEFQDLIYEGAPLYEHVGRKVAQWGESTIGSHGYSAVGAVVGATYPSELRNLRKRLEHTFFLVPGYGAQGGTAQDVQNAFDKFGRGAIVNASRSIMCAWKKTGRDGLDYQDAARAAAEAMRDDIKQYVTVL